MCIGHSDVIKCSLCVITEVHTNIPDNCPHCASQLSGGNLSSSHIQTVTMTTPGSCTRLYASWACCWPFVWATGKKKKQLHTGFTNGTSNDALTTWSYILPADAIVHLQGNIIHQKSADNDLRCQMCQWFLTLLRPPCLPLITKRNFFQPPTRLFCCLNVS